MTRVTAVITPQYMKPDTLFYVAPRERDPFVTINKLLRVCITFS